MGAVIPAILSAVTKVGMGILGSGASGAAGFGVGAATIGGAAYGVKKALTPQVPTIPSVAPLAPTVGVDPAGDSLVPPTTAAGAAAVKEKEKKKILGGRKKRPTIATGPLGLLEKADVGRKSLLGE